MRKRNAGVKSAIVPLACLFFLALPVAAQQVPGSVTPGGARPPEDRFTAPPASPPPALVIPSVPERGFAEADAGPRIQVSGIDLVIEPALALSAGDRAVAGATALVRQAQSARAGGDFAIRELEVVAESVTDYFRGQGFALAYAFLPAQDVPAGRVRIEVLAGRLGQVRLEGNKRYSEARVARVFRDLVDQPIRVSELESRILSVRDFPGLSPAPVLTPGSEPGTSDLVIRVTERPVELVLAGDNYGSFASGQYRASAELILNNPFTLGDRLALNVIEAFDPSDNTYGGIRYQVPLGDPRVNVYAGYSKSAYDVGSNASEIFDGQIDDDEFRLDGESSILEFGVALQLYRQTRTDIGLDVGLALKHAEFLDPGLVDVPNTVLREDDLSVAHVAARLERVDNLLGPLGINQLSIRWDRGLGGGFGGMGDDVGIAPGTESNPRCASTRAGFAPSPTNPAIADLVCASGSFDKYSATFQRIQRITENNSVILRGGYQWTDDLLVSLEQVGIGGPYSVRAYPIAQGLVDRGGFAGLEWVVDVGNLGAWASDRWDLSLFLFAEYGGGKILDAATVDVEVGDDTIKQVRDTSVDLSGWGGGFDFNWQLANRWRLNARVDVSTPISDAEPPSFDDDDPRFWGRVALIFR